MSAHFSKFSLNTYPGTPYFAALVPADYPLSRVLRKLHAFRRLPPNLKQLAVNSKRWAVANRIDAAGIDEWYDAQGYELDPVTGKRLTDAEIDAQWEPDPDLAAFTPTDVPVPDGGFPEPTTWQPSPEPSASPAPARDQVLRDVAARGIAYTSSHYGIDLPELPPEPTGGPFDAARDQFAKRVTAVLGSDYFDSRPEELRALQRALPAVDTHDDLHGTAEAVFDRVEEYELVKAEY